MTAIAALLPGSRSWLPPINAPKFCSALSVRLSRPTFTRRDWDSSIIFETHRKHPTYHPNPRINVWIENIQISSCHDRRSSGSIERPRHYRPLYAPQYPTATSRLSPVRVTDLLVLILFEARNSPDRYSSRHVFYVQAGCLDS